MRLLLRWIFYIACVAAAMSLLDIGYGQYGQIPHLAGVIIRNAGISLLLIAGTYFQKQIIDR